LTLTSTVKVFGVWEMMKKKKTTVLSRYYAPTTFRNRRKESFTC